MLKLKSQNKSHFNRFLGMIVAPSLAVISLFTAGSCGKKESKNTGGTGLPSFPGETDSRFADAFKTMPTLVFELDSDNFKPMETKDSAGVVVKTETQEMGDNGFPSKQVVEVKTGGANQGKKIVTLSYSGGSIVPSKVLIEFTPDAANTSEKAYKEEVQDTLGKGYFFFFRKESKTTRDGVETDSFTTSCDDTKLECTTKFKFSSDSKTVESNSTLTFLDNSYSFVLAQKSTSTGGRTSSFEYTYGTDGKMTGSKETTEYVFATPANLDDPVDPASSANDTDPSDSAGALAESKVSQIKTCTLKANFIFECEEKETINGVVSVEVEKSKIQMQRIVVAGQSFITSFELERMRLNEKVEVQSSSSTTYDSQFRETEKTRVSKTFKTGVDTKETRKEKKRICG